MMFSFFLKPVIIFLFCHMVLCGIKLLHNNEVIGLFMRFWVLQSIIFNYHHWCTIGNECFHFHFHIDNSDSFGFQNQISIFFPLLGLVNLSLLHSGKVTWFQTNTHHAPHLLYPITWCLLNANEP